AFAFIDPSVHRRALGVESILTGRTWEIGGAQIPHRNTSFDFLDQFGLGLSDRRLGRLENGELIAARTAVHTFECPDAQAGAHMDHEVERVRLADGIAARDRLEIDSLELRESRTPHVVAVVAI